MLFQGYPGLDYEKHRSLRSLAARQVEVHGTLPRVWTRPWGSDAAYRRVQSHAGDVRGPIQV